ncbi:histone-like nucleoid-structuring protein Lsr2 [Pseudarthrobacter oxydans]|uniref:histone-like nucleoid-structuring protein Lsr2 n=1 Tax=Pseudarthrobacter oxydans TaxID=1671 RepID=UPI00286B5C10|nr:Lsr2 family protein [Pseudarthrobacter oxydans]
MAKKTVVLLEDDIDGSEASETISFALDGSDYEIDLSEGHANELREALARFTNAGRKVAGGRGRPAARTRVAQVIGVLECLPSSRRGHLLKWGTNGSLLGCPRISGR